MRMGAHGDSMGAHGDAMGLPWVRMGMPWVHMGLPWVRMGFHGCAWGCHGCAWGMPWGCAWDCNLLRDLDVLHGLQERRQGCCVDRQHHRIRHEVAPHAPPRRRRVQRVVRQWDLLLLGLIVIMQVRLDEERGDVRLRRPDRHEVAAATDGPDAVLSGGVFDPHNLLAMMSSIGRRALDPEGRRLCLCLCL